MERPITIQGSNYMYNLDEIKSFEISKRLLEIKDKQINIFNENK